MRCRAELVCQAVSWRVHLMNENGARLIDDILMTFWRHQPFYFLIQVTFVCPLVDIWSNFWCSVFFQYNTGFIENMWISIPPQVRGIHSNLSEKSSSLSNVQYTSVLDFSEKKKSFQCKVTIIPRSWKHAQTNSWIWNCCSDFYWWHPLHVCTTCTFFEVHIRILIQNGVSTRINLVYFIWIIPIRKNVTFVRK